MRNIDYYGTELFLKSMETGGCLTGLVHEAKSKTHHFCSCHNSDCKLCKKEATQWLNEEFKRITEKEKEFLMLLRENVKYITFSDRHERIHFLDEDEEAVSAVRWAVFFEERPFWFVEDEETLSIEELLKLEVA